MSKRCINCGSEIQEDSVFCENCGKNPNMPVIEIKAPHEEQRCCKTCGEFYSKDLKNCPSCGAFSFMPRGVVKQCKNCGHPVGLNAPECPSCGEKTHFYIRWIISAICIIAVLAIYCYFLHYLHRNDVNNEELDKTEISEQLDAEGFNEDKENKENKEDKEYVVVYTDDFVEVAFMKLYTETFSTTFNLKLKITNKSDQKIKVSIDNVYLNDIVADFSTSSTELFEPGKISTSPFRIYPKDTELELKDIKKIEFNLVIDDEHYDLLENTEKIILNMK